MVGVTFPIEKAKSQISGILDLPESEFPCLPLILYAALRVKGNKHLLGVTHPLSQTPLWGQGGKCCSCSIVLQEHEKLCLSWGLCIINICTVRYYQSETNKTLSKGFWRKCSWKNLESNFLWIFIFMFISWCNNHMNGKKVQGGSVGDERFPISPLVFWMLEAVISPSCSVIMIEGFSFSFRTCRSSAEMPTTPEELCFKVSNLGLLPTLVEDQGKSVCFHKGSFFWSHHHGLHCDEHFVHGTGAQ